MTNEGLLSLVAARRYVETGTGKAIRLRAGLSMSKVGRAAGVSGQAVKNWEEGVCLPRPEAAVLWVQLLDALAEQERAESARLQAA